MAHNKYMDKIITAMVFTNEDTNGLVIHINGFKDGEQANKFAKKLMKNSGIEYKSISDIFDSTPPPKRTIRDTTNYGSRRGGSPTQSLAPLATMASYNTQYSGGCCARGSMIKMADGSTKQVENLRYGDKVMTVDIGSGFIKENDSALAPFSPVSLNVAEVSAPTCNISIPLPVALPVLEPVLRPRLPDESILKRSVPVVVSTDDVKNRIVVAEFKADVPPPKLIWFDATSFST